MSTTLKKFLWLNSICLLIWTSCTYSPDKEFFVNLPGPVTDNITLNAPADTIYLFQKSFFFYPLRAPGKEVYSSKVYVGDKLITSYSSLENIAFELDPLNFSSGVHPLSIEVTLSGGTGSLADKLGSEVVVLQKHFFVKVDIGAPSKMAAPEITIEDGRLMVRWNPSDKKNFLGYKLLKSYRSRDNIIKTDTIFSGGPESSYFHDELYTGGSVKYRVDIQGYMFYVEGQEKTFDLDPINLKVSLESDKTVKISWSDFKLYNNKLVFRLEKTTYENYSRPYPQSFNPIQTLGIQKDGEIELGFEGKFGNPEIYKFIISPDVENSYYLHNYAEEHKVGIGTKIHSFIDIAFCQEAEKMFLVHDLKQEGKVIRLVRYNLNTLAPIDSLDVAVNAFDKLLVSDNGQHIYITDKVGTDIQLLHFNAADLSLLETISVTGLVGELNEYGGVSSISNNNLLAIRQNYSQNLVVDMTLKSISWQNEPVTEVGYAFSFSPDGEYFFHIQRDVLYYDSNNKPVSKLFAYVHQWQNNDWKSLGKHEVKGYGFDQILGFKSAAEKGFFTINRSTSEEVLFYPIQDGALGPVKSYPRTDTMGYLFGYNPLKDAFNASFGNYSDSYLISYNYNTGQQSGRLNIDPFPGSRFAFYGDIYFANSGFYHVVP